MSLVLVDAHSHLHTPFPLAAYLDGAWENFRRSAASLGRSDWRGCLFLAETERSRARERLRDPGDSGMAGSGWSLVSTGEPVSRIVRHEDGRELVLVLGRQHGVAEGLEVLQVGALTGEDGSGGDLQGTIDGIRDAGGFPVIPWGFGKWSFGRKRVLLECLEQRSPGELALADSGLRPAAFPAHTVLARARELGFAVLAGTDPLPLRDHARRSGSLAAGLELSLGRERPWSRLVRRLASPDVRPAVVGERESLTKLLVDQARLRLL